VAGGCCVVQPRSTGWCIYACAAAAAATAVANTAAAVVSNTWAVFDNSLWSRGVH
jgi:hypothetical protein